MRLLAIIILLMLSVGCLEATPGHYLGDGDTYFVKDDYSLFEKIDNPRAKNPTLEELTVFLGNVEIQDASCGFCAEELHNKAEDQEIRVAIVFSHVGNGLHVFNLFETTDQGRIYADATNGLVAIAQEVNGEYQATKYLIEPTEQTQIQRFGSEKDFLIFW